MNIGEKIKEIRISKNLKQSDLAQRSGVSRVAIGNYERGDRQPNIDILVKIADALEVAPTELIGKDASKVIFDEIADFSQGVVKKIENMISVMNEMVSISGLTEQQSNDAYVTGLFEKILEILAIDNSLTFSELENLVTSDDFRSIIEYLLFKYKGK